ncbi:MAG: hypothetical protein GX649_14700 [Chloroflexi bacterium]|nr:hypothetical protein [Chloroflexota bacterium]
MKYISLTLVLLLLASGGLAGCIASAPPTADPTATPPATSLLPTAQPSPTSPAPEPEPTAEPQPTEAPTVAAPTEEPPEPPALGAIDLLAPLADLASYELSVALDVKSPETGRVSLNVTNEIVAAPEARRVTLKGDLDDEPLDLVIVEAEGQQFINPSGHGWQALSAEAAEPTDYTSFAQSVYDEVLAALEAEYVDTETIDGREAHHYRYHEEDIVAASVNQVVLDSAAAEAWVSPDRGLVLRSFLHLQGQDPEGNAYLMQIETTLDRIDEPLTIDLPTASEAPPAEALAAEDLMSLDEWGSARLQAVLEISAAEQGILSAEYAFTDDPQAARVLLEMAVADEAPASIEVIEAQGETYVDQDGSGEWFVTPNSLWDVLEGQDLAWMVDPLAILSGASLEYAGAERLGSLSVARYSADPEAVAANLPFGAVTVEEGAVQAWVATETLALVRLRAELGGTDSAGNAFALTLETEVTDLAAPIEIVPPGEEATIRPSDEWPATLSLADIRSAEELSSARLYVYLLRIGADGVLNAEVLHETDRPAEAERLVIAARRGEALAFSDIVQVGDETWIDDGGTGQWAPSEATIAERADIEAIWSGQLLAPLSAAPGTFVSLETVRGMEAGRYTWGPEALAGILGEGVAVESARADAWISPLFETPIQVQLLAQGAEGETLFVQYVVTDLEEGLGIAPPEAQYCPEARSLQMDEIAAGTLAAGETSCFKFIALADEAITLRMGTDNPNFDPALNVHDIDGNFLHYSDDGPDSMAPLLTFSPLGTGVYVAEVEGFDSATAGAFTIGLSFFDAEGTTTIDEAAVLEPEVATRGAITEGALLYIESHEETIYGQVYAVDGQRGDEIAVTVLAEEIGSRLDPRVFLLGPNLEVLADDDDGHGGLDARLEYTLRESGRHYVIVREAAGAPFGTEETHFYEITLAVAG